jgi:YebC/PmpR family DNA-binding regulatory protein
MPLDNIERAIKRASGSIDASELSEMTVEGYGPGGIAILLHALTDNRNRTISDIRNAFSRADSSLGESGCVTWMFEPKGVIIVDAGTVDREDLALFAINARADDVKIENGNVEIYTQPQDLELLRKTLEDRDIAISSAELLQVPKTLINLDEKSSLQALKLLDKLEELDDVQHVYTNADFSDEVLEKYQG